LRSRATRSQNIVITNDILDFHEGTPASLLAYRSTPSGFSYYIVDPVFIPGTYEITKYISGQPDEEGNNPRINASLFVRTGAEVIVSNLDIVPSIAICANFNSALPNTQATVTGSLTGANNEAGTELSPTGFRCNAVASYAGVVASGTLEMYDSNVDMRSAAAVRRTVTGVATPFTAQSNDPLVDTATQRNEPLHGVYVLSGANYAYLGNVNIDQNGRYGLFARNIDSYRVQVEGGKFAGAGHSMVLRTSAVGSLTAEGVALLDEDDLLLNIGEDQTARMNLGSIDMGTVPILMQDLVNTTVQGLTSPSMIFDLTNILVDLQNMRTTTTRLALDNLLTDARTVPNTTISSKAVGLPTLGVLDLGTPALPDLTTYTVENILDAPAVVRTAIDRYARFVSVEKALGIIAPKPPGLGAGNSPIIEGLGLIVDDYQTGLTATHAKPAQEGAMRIRARENAEREAEDIVAGLIGDVEANAEEGAKTQVYNAILGVPELASTARVDWATGFGYTYEFEFDIGYTIRYSYSIGVEYENPYYNPGNPWNLQPETTTFQYSPTTAFSRSVTYDNLQGGRTHSAATVFVPEIFADADALMNWVNE
jgi:hypothetical protein